jgi:hypothetical protein
MNKAEAKLLVSKELDAFAARPYGELVAKIGHTEVKSVVGESGAVYQIELDVFWDSKPNENLRIVGSIDDGGWRAFVPLTESRIMKADGTFV